MDAPQPYDYPNKLAYMQAWMEHIIRIADQANVIVTVERVPGPGPLAMRNHVAKIEVREKR
jgi:hypothetical protein